MRPFAPASLVALVAAAQIACSQGASSPGDAESLESAEADLAQTAGTRLRSSDRTLALALDMVDGTSARTRGKRFVRANFERAGARASAWCSLVAASGAAGAPATTTVVCTKTPRVGENEESDALFELRVTKTGEAFALDAVHVAQGGVFEGEANALFGVVGAPGGGFATTRQGAETSVAGVALEATQNGESPAKDPFALGQTLASALAGLVGERVGGETVVGYELDVNDDVAAFVRLKTSANTSKNTQGWVSLLKTPGVLGSGLADAATLADRVRADVR